MDQRILIAGCGYVGTRLALDLLGSTREIYGLRRNAGALPAGIRPVPADLVAPGALPEVPPLDALVYCPSAGGRTEDAYRRAYVDGVDRLLDALGERAPRTTRAVYVSSTAVWGDRSVGEVDERVPTAPSGFTGELLLRGEARFRERLPNGVVLRLSGIYGPGRVRLASQVAAGGPFETPPETIGNRIHLRDCAGAIAHLLALEAPEPLYVGVDEAPVPLGEVRAFVAERLGMDPSPFRPSGPATGKRLVGDRLRASGYRFRVPSYREGYPEIVDSIRPR